MDFQIDLDPTNGVIRPTLMTVWPTPEPFLIDHESAADRIKKAGRLLDEVLVDASCGMRDHDEAIHGSQDSEEKTKMDGISNTSVRVCVPATYAPPADGGILRASSPWRG